MNILFQKYHVDMDDKAIIEGFKTVTSILAPMEIVKGWKIGARVSVIFLL